MLYHIRIVVHSRINEVVAAIWGNRPSVYIMDTVFIALAFKIPPRMLIEDEALKKHFGSQWEKLVEKIGYRVVPWVY